MLGTCRETAKGKAEKSEQRKGCKAQVAQPVDQELATAAVK